MTIFDIDDIIAESEVEYIVMNGCVMVAQVKLTNGDVIYGANSCGTHDNFIERVCKEAALSDAKIKLWYYVMGK